MIKEFKIEPATEDFFDESSLIIIIKSGDFNKALKICNKNNISIRNYYQYFEEGVRKIMLHHRTSELLSFIFNNPNILDVDKIEILKKTFSDGDFHGFLKNCFRFQIYIELKDEIELAINKIRPEESVAWKKKFNTMK